MILFIFGVIVVILFVTGITFVFQGYRDVPDASRMVSKETHDKVKNDLNDSKEQEEKLKLKEKTNET